MVEIKTSDTYEASFYILNGGTVKEIEFGKLQPNRRRKEGYTVAYKITIANVDQRYIQQWKAYQTDGSIRDFANARRKLKRRIEEVRRRKHFEG